MLVVGGRYHAKRKQRRVWPVPASQRGGGSCPPAEEMRPPLPWKKTPHYIAMLHWYSCTAELSWATLNYAARMNWVLTTAILRLSWLQMGNRPKLYSPKNTRQPNGYSLAVVCVRAQNMAIQTQDRQGHKTCAVCACNAICALQCALHSSAQPGHKTPENRKFSTQVSWRATPIPWPSCHFKALPYMLEAAFQTDKYMWRKCNIKCVSRMLELKTLQVLQMSLVIIGPMNEDCFCRAKLEKNIERKGFLSYDWNTYIIIHLFLHCVDRVAYTLFVVCIHFQTLKR